MKSIQLIKQLSVAMLALAFGAQGVSAQVVGANLQQFNVLANPSVNLTGFSPTQPLIVPVVGSAPGIARAYVNASAGADHLNDALAVNGQTEATNLFNSLTAPAGANPVVAFGGTLPSGPLFPAPLPGINIYKTAASLSTTGGTPTIISGGVNDIVIFQVTTDLTNTDHDIQVFGILPKNVYWQVVNAASVTNDDASDRGFPGTIVNQTGAKNIAVVSSGAGALKIGNLYSIGGSVSITQSGAGVMTFDFAGSSGSPASPTCSDGGFFPSPATGNTGTFSYCMATAGTVKIKVYNANGDLATRIEGPKAAGTQTSSMNTGRLAPGVYLYTVERDYMGGVVSHSAVKKFAVKR